MQQPQFKIQGEGKKKKKKKKRKANYNVILYLLFPIYVTYKLQKYAPLVLYGFLNIIPKDPVFWVLDKKHHPKTFCQMLFNFFSFFFFNFFDLNTALFLSEFNKHLSHLIIIANSQNRDLSTITVVNVITLKIPTKDEVDFIRKLLYTSTTTSFIIDPSNFDCDLKVLTIKSKENTSNKCWNSQKGKDPKLTCGCWFLP